MGETISMEYSKYLTQTFKDKIFLYNVGIVETLRFKSRYVFLKYHQGLLLLTWFNLNPSMDK